MIEIKFLGRGGQGAVIASEILGKAFFLEGKYPQCFSLFGGERRGAPVFSFLRVDEEPILLKCQIKHPSQIVIFDLSLIDEENLIHEVKPEGLILINTNKGIDAFRVLKGLKVGLIDAGSIARSVGLGTAFNTAILGAYVRLTDLIRMETLIRAVREMVPAKADENIQAAQKAYEQTRLPGREG
ncbi:MAG: 2-oxoacid:acceptor oxidoreductase family protein [Thermodesulfobacteriota bacterium]